ncbi:cell wall-active antibiotics response protein LiaF [Brevibacillus migulae]|uniref:cell wall-active antibiotics response protein LiaF n=1 Tax=Brevibacillus migulae TaxID=1644114 RepID=UPI00106E8089|nr:cell wall-active antibiotics response protein LiaF [Brevibacillus migulae]
MKLSRLHTMLVGIVIMIAGVGLFLDGINLIEFDIWQLWPVILLYFGLREWSKGARIIGGILTGLGTLFLLHLWFDVQINDVFYLIVSMGLLYFGFQMIRSRKGKETQRPVGQPVSAPADPHLDESVTKAEEAAYETMKLRMDPAPRMGGTKNTRSALIGDFHLTSGRFELSNMHVWHGIGNVVIDLSRAVIQEEEAQISIKGWVGDITIYVPVDLPVSVGAEVMVGDLGIFGHHQGGLNRCVSMRSDSYDSASQKVALNISLLIGDIEVKYI